jgi:hypothetical protein
MQTRESDGPDHAIVIAAGYAYHAGRGGFRGERRDWACLGLEIEHTGVVPLPDHRREVSLEITAAMFGPYGDAEAMCQHSEWSEPPGSKIDVATGVNPDEWRRLLADVLSGEDVGASREEIQEIIDNQSRLLGKWEVDTRQETRNVGFILAHNVIVTLAEKIPELTVDENELRTILNEELDKLESEPVEVPSGGG